MPKVKFKPAILEIRGTLYDVVFKKSPQGKMIVTKRPDMSHVEWSPAQKAQRRRIAEATAYAKALLADPRVRLRYERKAQKQNKRAWDLALSDYFKGENLRSKQKTEK